MCCVPVSGSPLSPSQFAEVFQFGPGVTEPEREDVSDVTNLSCFILMLDLVIMQVGLRALRSALCPSAPFRTEVAQAHFDFRCRFKR